MMLSAHVSMEDATASQTATRKGIDNTPPKSLVSTLKATAEGVFEPLWEASGGRIRISSFYRSEALNRAVGGSKTSQHVKGEAIDLVATGDLDNKQLLALARKLPQFDQLISEFGTLKNPAWVHVSLKKTGNRRMELRIG